jgi:hypothetical protein
MNGYCKKEGTTLRMIIYKIGQPSVQSQLVIQKFINKPAHSVGTWRLGLGERQKLRNLANSLFANYPFPEFQLDLL